jgi:hypothetical protein
MPIRDTGFDAIYGKEALITRHVIPLFDSIPTRLRDDLGFRDDKVATSTSVNRHG